MHQYYIYGLGIHTEVKLYDLDERKVQKDVLIHYGVVPGDIAAYTEKGLTSTMSPSRVWFRNDIGHFVITGGNDILVQPIGNAGEDELASFILGWCIAFLFQLRGATAIHSSAIEMDKQAVLISGFSGSGKSTTALSLIEAGYRYLADDIAMVDPSTDMMIQPAFPQQKVCRNVAEKMESSRLVYINERKDKFAYQNIDDFCDVVFECEVDVLFLSELFGQHGKILLLVHDGVFHLVVVHDEVGSVLRHVVAGRFEHGAADDERAFREQRGDVVFTF